MITTICTVGLEGTQVNIVKATYDKSTARTIPMGKNYKGSS